MEVYISQLNSMYRPSVLTWDRLYYVSSPLPSSCPGNHRIHDDIPSTHHVKWPVQVNVSQVVPQTSRPGEDVARWGSGHPGDSPEQRCQ